MTVVNPQTIKRNGNLSERNRPKTFDAVIGNETTISALRDMLARYKQFGEQPPHLLFKGMHGTGKTTLAEIFSNEYLGGIKHDINFFAVNGSDERKIDDMRDKIIPLTKLMIKLVIFISEADKLTHNSQALLKRVMETTRNALFILDLNDETCIIDPIKSRCAEFAFRPLNEDAIVERIYKVFDAEGIKYNLGDEEVNAIKYIVSSSKGDMRKIFMNIEKVITATKEINPQNIMELNKSINIIVDCIKQALAGDVVAAKNSVEDAYIMSGYNTDFVMDSFKSAINDVIDPVKDKDIYAWAYARLAELQHRLIGCHDPVIALWGYVCELWRAPYLRKN